MSKKNFSWRRYSVLAAACVMFGIAGRSQAQVTFTPPVDAPDGGVGTVGILRVFVPAPTVADPNARQAVNNQDDARAMLLSPLGNRSTAVAPVINHVADGGGLGHFPFKLDNVGGDNKSYIFRGNVNVPSAGVYTFNVNSDDGFTLAFNNGAVPFSNLYNQDNGNPGSIVTYNGNANGALTFFGGRGTADTGAQVSFPAAGTYHFDMTFHDGCCGDAVELSSAPGAKTGFDSTFGLVGGAGGPVTKRMTGVGPWDTYTLASVSGMAATITAYNNGAPATSRTHTSEATLAFQDPEAGNVGSHGGDVRAFPGDTPGVGDDNFGLGAKATFTVSAANAGRYTILVNSDDGFRFRILNGAVPMVPIAGANAAVDVATGGLVPNGNPDGCCADFIGKFDLPAGTYTMEAIQNEMGGGAGMVVYGALGDFNSFEPAVFQLIGQNIDQTTIFPAGLQLVAAPEPGSIALIGLAGIAALGRRRRNA